MIVPPPFSLLPFTQQIAQKTSRSFFSSERALLLLSIATLALLSLTLAIYSKSLKYRTFTKVPQSEPSTTQTLFTQIISSPPGTLRLSHQNFSEHPNESRAAFPREPDDSASSNLCFPQIPVPTSVIESISDREQAIPEPRVALKLTLPEGISFEGSILPTENAPLSPSQLSSSFQGSLLYPDGTTIKGLFEKGELNGEGSVFYGDCQTEASGHFTNGNLVEGIASYADGEIIEGTFHNHKLNGFGKVAYKDGMIRKGLFADGMLEGKGEIIVPRHQSSTQSPHYLNGCFKADELISGEMVYADRTLTGTFKNHLLEGPGCTTTYGDDDIFLEGEFKAGMLEGLGQITYKRGPRLEGFFKQGELNGPATITYADQRTAQGFFIDGELNGIGRIELMDGAVHEGLFKNGALQGLGQITLPDGTFFAGSFEGGLLNGPGQIGSPTGQLKQGLFANGSLTSSESIALPEIPTLDLSRLAKEYLSTDSEEKSPFITLMILTNV